MRGVGMNGSGVLSWRRAVYEDTKAFRARSHCSIFRRTVGIETLVSLGPGARIFLVMYHL